MVPRTSFELRVTNGGKDPLRNSSKRKCRVNPRLIPVKAYYFLNEGGGSISPFVSLLAKQIGLSASIVGVVNTMTVALVLVSKPLIGGLIDKFGHQKLLWLVCHVLTVSCFFSLIFINPQAKPDFNGTNLTTNFTNDGTTEHCNSSVTRQFVISPQLWWWSIAVVTAGVAKRLVEVIQTSVVYGILDTHHSLFGKQKVFGSIGFAIAFISGGILNQYATDHVGNDEYYYSFYIYVVSMGLASVIICWFQVQPQPRPQHVIHKVSILFVRGPNLLFCASVFFMGTFTSYMSTYSFWYLTELGTPPLLLGLAKGAQSLLGEIPCLYISGWLMKRIGHTKVVTGLFFIQTINFAIYALMDDIRLVFVTEVINGIIYGFFLPTATSYFTNVAPPGMTTTLQGIFFALYKGAGRMMGNLVGGIMYSAFGGRITYFTLCGTAFVCFVGHAAFHLVVQRHQEGILKINSVRTVSCFVNKIKNYN